MQPDSSLRASSHSLPLDDQDLHEDHLDADLLVDQCDADDEVFGHENRKGKRKRDGSTFRKAPQAPKRFKSSYICFFMAKQPEIKKALGDQASVAAVSKRSAELWKNLPTADRAYWDGVAAKDKQRYNVEKASYTGPWQIPWKRAKKDPSAPKRPMSAFLYFSQGRRAKIKDENPDMKNTEVSRILGEMWRSLTDEGRRPYVDFEKEQRDKYKIEMADWRKDFEAKQEEERREQAELAAAPISAASAAMPMQQAPYDPYQMHPPPAYMYPPYPYPYPPGPYPFHSGGKKPIVLGPNGTPIYPPPSQSYPMSHHAPPNSCDLEPTSMHPMQYGMSSSYDDGLAHAGLSGGGFDFTYVPGAEDEGE